MDMKMRDNLTKTKGAFELTWTTIKSVLDTRHSTRQAAIESLEGYVMLLKNLDKKITLLEGK